MALPKKVREQVEAAESAYKEVYGKKDEGGDEQVNEPEETPKAENSEAQPEQQQEPVKEQPKDDAATWEQRYRVLQGKYDAEVPRLHRQVRQLNEKIEELQAVIEAFEQRQQEPEPEPQQSSERLLNESDIEDYGEDLIDVIKRAAKEELLPELRRLEEENARLKQQLSGVSSVVVETAREKLERTLDTEVPNWRELNEDSEFLDWLDQIDEFSGVRRLDLLRRAYEANDAPRVVAFFKGFIKEHAALNGAHDNQQNSAQQSPKVAMETLVAPGKPKGGDSAQGSTQTDGRVWTQSEIAAFYRDVQRGKFNGRESEKQAIEREIVEAVRTGRIR